MTEASLMGPVNQGAFIERICRARNPSAAMRTRFAFAPRDERAWLKQVSLDREIGNTLESCKRSSSLTIEVVKFY
jgi:hypothetical protein